MAAMTVDSEKAFAPYTDDEHALPKAPLGVSYVTRIRQKRSQWFSWKIAILTGVIILLVTARLVEGPIKAQWRRKTNDNPNYPLAPPTSLEEGTIPTLIKDLPAPIVDSLEAVPSYPADLEGISFLNDPADSDASAKAATVGVSVAASVSGEGSRQVYDLDSEGTIRVRKVENGTYRYTPPEIVKTGQKPKAGSPLSALSWKADGKTHEYRLFFINDQNSVVALGGTSANATAPINWSLLFVSGTKAAGGLVGLNIGPRYDPKTLAGQIRVLFVDTNGDIRHLNTLEDKWYIGSTGFKAVLGSDVTINAIRDPTSGQVTDISVIYLGAKEGLKEFVCDEKNKRNEYAPARPVDPKFSTSSPGHFAATFGGPPPLSRVYTLSDKAPTERTGTRAGWYTTEWWQTADNSYYVPEKAGGSVAAVAWGDKEVRVFFKSKAGKLTEVGLSDQAGDGTKWFPRGYIY